MSIMERWSLLAWAVGVLVQIGAAVQARRTYTNVYWWLGISAIGFGVMALGMLGVLIGAML